jgi:hypothetical protein
MSDEVGPKDAAEDPAGLSRHGDPAAELERAVELASALLVAHGHDVTALRITDVRNVLRGPGGPDAWRVTFKLRRLIPLPGEEIGTGGEWFVDVDLGSGTARLGGIGE